MSVERRKMLALLGAELVLTEGPKGMKGAIAKADELAAPPRRRDSAAIREPGQPGNSSRHHRRGNLERHRRQSRHLRFGHRHRRHDHRRRPGDQAAQARAACRCRRAGSFTRLSGGQPGPHKIQGIGAGFAPKILDTTVYDEVVKVSNDDAFANARLVARLEGVPVGISSGAALQAAIVVGSRKENAGKNMVVIIPSFAERYLSTVLFEGLGG